MKKITPILLAYLFVSLSVTAQVLPKGTLFFDQLLEYQLVEVDGTKSNIQLLLNTKTGMFGFDKNMTTASGWGEDIDFIAADSIGNFYFYGKDPEAGKMIVKNYLKDVVPNEKQLLLFKKQFASHFKPTEKNRKMEGLTVQSFSSPPDREGSFEKISFAKVNFNVYPIYLFNTLLGDVKLPGGDRMNFSGMLTTHQLLVESVLLFPKEKLSSSLKLTFYTPTEYYFETKGYKVLQGNKKSN